MSPVSCSPATCTMITVRVSQINRCPFCAGLSSAVLAERSGSMEKIDARDHYPCLGCCKVPEPKNMRS